MEAFAFKCGVFLLAFALPVRDLGVAIGFFLLTDLVTGIWASAKAGKRITSDRFSHSIVKSVSYLIAIIVAHAAELYALPGVPLTKVVGGLVASTELISVYENLTRISGVDFRRKISELLKPSQAEKEDRGELSHPNGEDQP